MNPAAGQSAAEGRGTGEPISRSFFSADRISPAGCGGELQSDNERIPRHTEKRTDPPEKTSGRSSARSGGPAAESFNIFRRKKPADRSGVKPMKKSNLSFRSGILILLSLLFSSAAWLRAGSYRVTAAADTGAGSLRWAIEQANGNGPDTVLFEIPGSDAGFNGAVYFIWPQSPLPALTGDSTFIDGFSQTRLQDSNVQGPEIMIHGGSAGPAASGFNILSKGNRIAGLILSGFGDSGIQIHGGGARDNRIEGCFLGTSPDGKAAWPNRFGIYCYSGAALNRIGGESPDEWNLISGNISMGIHLASSDSNRVAGNRIGTDADGSARLPNGMGIGISSSSAMNRIGGVLASERNVVSGNRDAGILITGKKSENNIVLGNFIGLAESGQDTLSNKNGIVLSLDAKRNQIGDAPAGSGNVISGNRENGIYVTEADSNWIQGNWIGTDPDGMRGLGNLLYGIRIIDSRGCMVGEGAANILSGNRLYGIQISGSRSVDNVVSNNGIGVDSTGGGMIGNRGGGIEIMGSASRNRIGPDNRILNNRGNGILITGANTRANRITRNSIAANRFYGILLSSGGNHSMPVPEIRDIEPVRGIATPLAFVEIFSDSAGQGRVFEAGVQADNTGQFSWDGNAGGPYVTATATDDLGNTSGFSQPVRPRRLIVTSTADDGPGTLRYVLNQAALTVGPDTVTFDIPASDPGFDGSVWTIVPRSPLPVIRDDSTALDGASQRINQGDKNADGPEIVLDGSALDTVASGLRITSGYNRIEGFCIGHFNEAGITLSGSRAYHNEIIGNTVGMNASGSDTMSNGTGIWLRDGADQNRVTGGNLISGNRYAGIAISGSGGNRIFGNRIGTDRSGKISAGNGAGVRVEAGSTGNRIGSAEEGGNLISGNRGAGIVIHGRGSTGNLVQGNRIGTEHSGKTALGNAGAGVWISGKAAFNIVGGAGAGEGNLISGNLNMGINLGEKGTEKNQVLGNRIGTDETGTAAVPNAFEGVRLYWEAKNNQIGPGNLISGNKSHGIIIVHAGTDSNSVGGNGIGLDSSGQDTIPNRKNGILIDGGARHNRIGGAKAEDRNVIAGNGLSGVALSGDSTGYNTIQNNFIGTDGKGSRPLGNRAGGISIAGVEDRVRDNLLSGNRGPGIWTAGFSERHEIYNNRIGVKPDGTTAMPNEASGIHVGAGGSSFRIGPRNQICFNRHFGILISDGSVVRVTISRNSIADNDSGGVAVRDGANQNLQPPTVSTVTPLSGTAASNSIIEIYSDMAAQGRFYEGSVYADGSGRWTWSGHPQGPHITCSATDPRGNTSAFSDPVDAPADAVGDVDAMPETFYLSRNFPNPFNPVTAIPFGVPERCHVLIKVYNAAGREMGTLADADYEAGHHRVELDADSWPNGVYLCRIQAGAFKAAGKMMLIK